MKTTEFMFRFPGYGNEASRYSVIVVHGVSVTFIRIGAADQPFSLMVPRVHDETFAHARAEDLARLAIAQAIYAELFDTRPQGVVDLEVHGPLWEGDLEVGQWQHAMPQPAPEAPAAREQAKNTAFVPQQRAESDLTIETDTSADISDTAALP
jgi:hypothetical protein